jgi:hypothetical protein
MRGLERGFDTVRTFGRSMLLWSLAHRSCDMPFNGRLLQDRLDHLVPNPHGIRKAGSKVILDLFEPITVGFEVSERHAVGPPLARKCQ